ncbi:YihY/virulence factor BrkB family protein [Halomicrobium salinisoli]|uniref:YihY/virulence factor BrkB family protein n=1 Tax=Halomicrobium salinisoli TaxID=2878391 RepID=UPI001CF0D21A|nr:YihY/virulence factor BrkB family protein [Halomicrobium salinisoli]
MVSTSNVVGVGKRVFSDFSDKNVTFMAAGLAYYAFVSLAPTLLLFVLVLTTLGAGLKQRIVEAVQNYMPGPISNVVTQILQSEASIAGTGIIGIVVILWGALKIFRGLDTAFSEIYETESDNSFTDTVRDGLVVILAVLLAVVTVVGATLIFGIFSDTVPLLGLLTPLILVAGLALAFYPMFYVFPDVDMELTDPLPGVLFAAVGWAVFQALFQVYLSFSDPGSGGFAGGIIVVITYLYFSSLVFLLGAVLNAVLGGHSSGKPGGVGRGSATHRTLRKESLDRRELAAYLDDLRTDLLGYDGVTPSPTQGEEDHGRPEGEVRLVEHSSSEGDERSVTLQWEVAEERLEGPTADARDAEDADVTRRSGDSGRPRGAGGDD